MLALVFVGELALIVCTGGFHETLTAGRSEHVLFSFLTIIPHIIVVDSTNQLDILIDITLHYDV